MEKNCVFTICAKNYLAQALTLRDSVLSKNENIDFFLFLADKVTSDVSDLDLVELDDSWISNWKSLAYKYNVIEFSTSIKPFCFLSLFQKGYDKVIYLDPDIYVLDSLDHIYGLLDNKSIVLSPHYCEIQESGFNGSVSEETFMADGIFNLGFTAIKNNVVGNKIAKWWSDRLEGKCYADIYNALFVDQKWMDFIPAFFPNDVEISHHMGINVAIWNLHERSLIEKDGKYWIENLVTKELFPLLFFHFSGFDPFNKSVFNRRHAEYNVDTYPSYRNLINVYADGLYANNYDKYSALTYDFTVYDNGEEINELNQRLYREMLSHGDVLPSDNPFSTESKAYAILNKHGLLTHNKKKDSFVKKVNAETASKFENKFLFPLLRVVHFIFGNKIYYQIIKCSRRISKYEYHYFLINKK
ncbi:MAG: hypothetical protein J6Y11_03645 [Paludibacteraceae bacterium]|nr:hypothetical protein [Paludibacteraceae bacterium]